MARCSAEVDATEPQSNNGEAIQRGEIPVAQSGVKSQRIVALSMPRTRFRGIEQSTLTTIFTSF